MARDNLTPLGTKFSLLSSLACCPDKELVSPKSTSLLLSGRGGGDHSVKRKKVPSIKYNLHLNRSHHIYIYINVHVIFRIVTPLIGLGFRSCKQDFVVSVKKSWYN